jgi:hypothetical protein
MTYLKHIIASLLILATGSIMAQQGSNNPNEPFQMQNTVDCAKTDIIVKLVEKYGEVAQHSSANANQGYVITFWYNSNTGTSTYTGTFIREDITCIIADGKKTVFRGSM